MNAPRALLVPICLALLSPGISSAVQVTFQVNMSAQAGLGNFRPSTDQVVVAGDPLNGWSTTESQLTESTAAPGIWTGTFEIPSSAGATVSYKFVIVTPQAAVWEGNVGSGGGTGNRTFTLAAADQTLPVVFFNNVSSSTSVTPKVTFQVNMAVQTAAGNFDPAAGTVSVAGEFNNWNTSALMLERSTTNPDVWAGTLSITGAVNSALSYKFVINGGTWEGNVGQNGAQNRSFALSRDDQTLPVVFFDNATSLGTLSMTPLVNGRTTLSWTAGPRIRLQRSAELATGPWQTVPGTEGQGSATVEVTPGPAFFRLVGP